MPNYKFGEIKFNITSDFQVIDEKLKYFIVRNLKHTDIYISINGLDYLEAPSGEVVLFEPINDGLNLLLVKGKEGNDLSFYITGENKDAALCRLDIDSAWKNASIKYLRGESNYEYLTIGVFGNLLIRNKMVLNRGLVIHSSAIRYKKRGIIFSAPSGTGKSTHTALWEMYYNARVINDDCPPIRIMSDVPYVFGSPWSGSTNKFKNESAPLSAIILLEQSKTNSIERINPIKCPTYLLPRCYMPYYDTSMMDTAMNTLEDIIKAVPVFLLKCRPDKEAVDIVYRTVIGNM